MRTGLPADMQHCAAIERASTAWPWSLSQFLSSSLRDSEHSLVLESAGQVAGFLVYQQVLDESTLMNIAVLPEYRRQGGGAQLVAALLERLRRAGTSRCLLEVRSGNAAAIALYRRFGFTEDGTRRDYYPAEGGREDALLMSVDLELGDVA